MTEVGVSGGRRPFQFLCKIELTLQMLHGNRAFSSDGLNYKKKKENNTTVLILSLSPSPLLCYKKNCDWSQSKNPLMFCSQLES